MTAEDWRPIPGTDGRYEASADGRIRKHLMRRTRELTGHRTPLGYVLVSVNNRARFRHVLVASAFYGEPQPGQMVRHLNGVPGDDRVENLKWGTAKENAEDSKRHGTNYALNKTHCKWEHEFTDANTFIDNLGRRICRTCKARHMRAEMDRITRERRAAKTERLLADPTREVRAVLPDGSELVHYGSKCRYYREWPLSANRNRQALSAAEFRVYESSVDEYLAAAAIGPES